jgi:DNA-binding response OmpR family regulator
MLRKLPIPRKARPAPVAPPAGGQAAHENSSAGREDFLSPVILVVERDRLLLWALYETLADAGFRVLTAHEGRGAEALLPDIAQDLSLALVDDESWPLTRSARAALHRRWPTLPIVVMSQSDDPDLERLAREHGATAVLTKPFDLADVLRLAERLAGPARPGEPSRDAGRTSIGESRPLY